MDFTEPIQLQFTDETLDAVCLKDLVHTSVLGEICLCLEEICIYDTVSLSSFQCTEVKATSSTITQSFLGRESLRMMLFSSSLGISGFGPCGGGLSQRPGSGVSGWSPCYCKASPESTFGSGEESQGSPAEGSPSVDGGSGAARASWEPWLAMEPVNLRSILYPSSECSGQKGLRPGSGCPINTLWRF